MNGLEQSARLPKIGAGAQPQASYHPCRLVAQDVSEEVGGDQDIEPLRVSHQVVGGRVHQHILIKNAPPLRHLPAGLQKEPVASQHIGLMDDSKTAASRRQVACSLCDPLRTATGYHPQGTRFLHPHLLHSGVEPLSILPHNDEIKVMGLEGPDVGIKVQGPAQP